MFSFKGNFGTVLGIVVALVIAVYGGSMVRYMGLQKIQNDEDMYSIYIDKDWHVEYADPAPDVDVSGAFAFDDSRENFIFVVVSPSEEQNFDQDLEQWQKQFEPVGFKYTKCEKKKINGQEVVMYEANVFSGEIPYFQKGFITYKNGNKYAVLAQCKEENKEMMIKDFDKSFKSFKLY